MPRVTSNNHCTRIFEELWKKMNREWYAEDNKQVALYFLLRTDYNLQYCKKCLSEDYLFTLDFNL